jgi:hypothetical protein
MWVRSGLPLYTQMNFVLCVHKPINLDREIPHLVSCYFYFIKRYQFKFQGQMLETVTNVKTYTCYRKEVFF